MTHSFFSLPQTEKVRKWEVTRKIVMEITNANWGNIVKLENMEMDIDKKLGQ